MDFINAAVLLAKIQDKYIMNLLLSSCMFKAENSIFDNRTLLATDKLKNVNNGKKKPHRKFVTRFFPLHKMFSVQHIQNTPKLKLFRKMSHTLEHFPDNPSSHL